MKKCESQDEIFENYEVNIHFLRLGGSATSLTPLSDIFGGTKGGTSTGQKLQNLLRFGTESDLECVSLLRHLRHEM